MENEILKEIHFDSEKGGLFYKDVRYLLVRPETLAAFQKAIEKELGERGSQILYESGFHGGTLSARRYREVFHLSDEEIIHFMIRMGAQIGWGQFQQERFDPERKTLRVQVLHSPFAEAYGPSSLSVCHFIRGVIGGLASMVFGQGVRSREASCLAKGDRYCLFEAQADVSP